MKWRGRRQSDNVRGGGVGKKGGFSLIGIVAGLIMYFVFGVNPMTAFQASKQVSEITNSSSSSTSELNDSSRDVQFVKTVLADTEEVWHRVFKEAGSRYEEPQLVIFNRSVTSACGSASSATGPFYCPADKNIYLDTSFFVDMRRQFNIAGDQQGTGEPENAGKAGDFAQAYVIAHEVGHHIQNITGTAMQVSRAQKNARSKAQANDLSVRQELQADCYAGVWAVRNQERVKFLEAGDIQEALNAASMIGDDRIAQASGNMVVPDNFTHGSSEQRVTWFVKGFKTGNINSCNTFSGNI